MEFEILPETHLGPLSIEPELYFSFSMVCNAPDVWAGVPVARARPAHLL